MCSGMNYIVVIKNKTDIDLNNLQLIWLRKPDIPVEVKDIKKGDFQRVSLPNLVYGTAPLKMYYLDKLNVNHEYPILAEITGFQEKYICITITEISEYGELKYEVNPNYY